MIVVLYNIVLSGACILSMASSIVSFDTTDNGKSGASDSQIFVGRIFMLILALVLGNMFNALSAQAAEPWSPQAVNITAPETNGSVSSSTASSAASSAKSSATTSDTAFKAPAYQNKGIENALDIGDYSRAQTLITNKLNNLSNSKNSFDEAYLRTALVESLLGQGQLPAAAVELKKLKKVLDSLKPGAMHSFTLDDERELTARAMSDESWLLQGLGKMEEAQTVVTGAIVKLKELHAVDRQTWRLLACLSHSAALKATGGDYDGAKQLLEDALAQVGGSHSLSPLNVADIQESLASVLFRMGDQKDASMHFNQSIAIKNATGALTRRYAPGPYWLSPSYRYIEGSPWSGKTFQNGLEKKTVDVGAVRVEAAVMRDKTASKQMVQVMLSVTNRTNQSVEFMGQRPEFVTISPKVFFAKMIDPNTLAAQIQKKGDGKAKWIRFWGQGATQSVSTTYMGNMPFYGYGYGNGYPPVMGYGGAMPFVSRSNGMTNVITQVPDPMAEARAFQKASQVEGAARAKADDIVSKSLGPSDIAAGQTLSGSIYFDAAGLANSSACLVRIPIGNSQFEFRFDTITGAP
jgi:hypothetical protein